MDRYKFKRIVFISVVVVVNLFLFFITAKSVGGAIARQLHLDIVWNFELLLKLMLLINGSILLLFGLLIVTTVYYEP